MNRDLQGRVQTHRPRVNQTRTGRRRTTVSSLTRSTSSPRSTRRRRSRCWAPMTKPSWPLAARWCSTARAGAARPRWRSTWRCTLPPGKPWLGLDVPRRCRVLVIENEGPRGKFRRKLRAKLDAWAGTPVAGYLYVLEEPWARFTFADAALRAAARGGHPRTLDRRGRSPGRWAASASREAERPREVRTFMGLLEQVRADLDRPLAIGLSSTTTTRRAPSRAPGRACPTRSPTCSAQGNGATRVEWEKVRWSSDLHGRTWKLLWRPGESFELDETPETTDEDIREAILAAVGENPGARPGGREGTSRARPTVGARCATS